MFWDALVAVEVVAITVDAVLVVVSTAEYFEGDICCRAVLEGLVTQGELQKVVGFLLVSEVNASMMRGALIIEAEGIADVDGVEMLGAIELRAAGHETRRDDACFDVVHDAAVTVVALNAMCGACSEKLDVEFVVVISVFEGCGRGERNAFVKNSLPEPKLDVSENRFRAKRGMVCV